MKYRIIESYDELLRLEWIEISLENSKNITGVYMLVDRETGNIDYVGRSISVYKRLSYDHPIYNPDIHSIKILKVDENMLRYYEALSIQLLKPRYNRRMGFWPREAVIQTADHWWKNHMG